MTMDRIVHFALLQRGPVLSLTDVTGFKANETL